jgi:hypothetical protein
MVYSVECIVYSRYSWCIVTNASRRERGTRRRVPFPRFTMKSRIEAIAREQSQIFKGI